MTNKKVNLTAALIAGGVAGIVSGLVKLGWENVLPPRTPQRNATNPPQQLLQQVGVPANVTHATYTYSGQQLPFVSYLVHFGFSTSFAMLYSVGEHYVPVIRAGQGTAFGLFIWGAFHHAIMPALHTIPRVKDQPLEEHISEGLGHMTWMWTNDLISNQIYQQLTKNQNKTE